MCSRAVFQQPYNNHHYPARCKFKLWSINEKHPFQLWCWRRLLRVPWTARRSNQSILKEINSECSLEGLMQKLKHLASWCKEPIHWKDPDAGKDWGQEEERDNWGWDGWMASLTQWTWIWANFGDSEGQGSLACYSPWVRRVGHNSMTEQQPILKY